MLQLIRPPPLAASTMFRILFLLVVVSVCHCSGYDFLKLQLHHSGRPASLEQALAGDFSRLSSLSLSAPLISGAAAGSGQYFVHLHLGTPTQPLRLVADTGSDLIWSRCSPCLGPSCPRLHPPGSVFLPRLSSSFSPFHCFHPSCDLISHPPSSRCNRTRLHSPCRFRYSYADRSASAGFFSHDTATLNHTTIPNLSFGCAFQVLSGPSLASALGILGLGRGPISLPSQAAPRFGRVFSYCLLDYTLSPPPASFLFIGHTVLSRSNPHLRYTPLLPNPLSPTFYYVRITGVSVNGVVLPINQSVWEIDPETGNGGTIVDSGTTLSFFPAAAYAEVLAAMARRIPKKHRISTGPPGFDLCVNASSEGLRRKRMPRLAVRMEGGAELVPPAGNYFIDAADGVACLAVQTAGQAGFGVIGNLMQQGFLLVFDREKGRLGFSRRGCSGGV